LSITLLLILEILAYLTKLTICCGTTENPNNSICVIAEIVGFLFITFTTNAFATFEKRPSEKSMITFVSIKKLFPIRFAFD
jgi:hypothetical protein